MKACPRCKSRLTRFLHGEVELDHCQRCGGNFFDVGEAAARFGAAAEPESWVASACAFVKGDSELPCPAGHGPLLAYDLSFSDEHVEVDVCRTCRGMWLDADEGGRLEQVVSKFDEAAATAERSRGARRYWFMLFTGFPIEVFHPVRRRPFVLSALVALLVVVFVGSYSWAWNQPDRAAALRGVFQTYGLVPAQFLAGQQAWALVTHTLLHAGIVHLFGNLYFLWIFGDNLEDRLGRVRFLTIYGLAGIAGGLLHAVMLPESAVPAVGASGAISGVMAAYLVLFPRVRLWVVWIFVRFRCPTAVFVGLWLLLQFAGLWSDVVGIAWFAHLGGFGAGGVAAFCLRPRGLSPARGA